MTRGLRPLVAPDDLPAVAHLIEIGFGAELDPAGQSMLRLFHQWGNPFGWTRLLFPPPSLYGFVWVEDGAIVGNLTLRRAAPRRKGGYLIGNVVVHPDYRRRGIARALMERALEEVRRRRGRWVGLEVRVDNAPALSLYRRLGFVEVGETVHYLRADARHWPDLGGHRHRWRKATPDDHAVWLALAHAMYGRAQADVLEVDGRRYAYGGWGRAVDLWLARQREWAWLDRSMPPRRAIYARRDGRGGYYLWEMYLHPEVSGQAVEEAVGMLASTTHRRPRLPVILYFPPSSVVEGLLLRAGFHQHRRLYQMRLDLRPSARLA